MRIFRSRTNLQKLLSWTFLLVLPLGMLGVFQLAFSHFAFAVDSNPGTPSSEINVDLVNGIAVRILDEAGQQQIDNINLDLTAVPGGSFVSGKFNVEVSTSNKTGYKLYMDSSYDQSSVMGTTSPDYTTNLVNQTNTSYIIPTLTNNVSLAEFQSGSNNSSNKWGYSLDDTTFSPIPVHATPDMVDSSSTPTASTLTPVTIGTNVNMDMASGVYKNQLTFSAVAEAIPINYTLSFDAASGENAPDPLTATTISGSATFTIPDHMPSYYKYNSSTGVSTVMGFKGWSESSSSETGSGSGPNGLYVPGDELTITAEGWDAMSKTLYAVYETATFWNIAAMQQMSSSLCSSIYTPSNSTAMSTPAVTIVDNEADYTNLVSADNQPYVAQRILYDIRDGNSYRVRKLADGNCWMTENLRLEFDGNTTYDSSTTNLALGTTITPSATQARTSAPTAAEIAEWTYDDNRLTTDEAYARDSVNQWRSRSTRGMREANLSVGNRTGENQYLGTYYNWYTATASTGTYDIATDYAPSDVCPTNWQLPRGNTSTQSYDGLLTTTYNIISASGEQGDNYTTALSKMNSKPLSIFAAGFVSWQRGAYTNQGTQGIYWAAGNYYWDNKLTAKALNFYPTTIYLYNNRKLNGDIVRCVVK